MFKAIKAGIVSSILIGTAAWAFASCPIDGSSMYFTGNTQVVDGVLLKEYRCPRGHISWGR